MYGKLVNGRFKKAPSRIKWQEHWVFAPHPDKLIQLGYKELIDDLPDELLELNEYYDISYTEDETHIYKHYTKMKIPEE